MQFGKIDGFILLGGGQLVAEVAFRLAERGRNIKLVTSPRHAHELVSGSINLTLSDYLDENGIGFSVSDNIATDAEIKSAIDNQHMAISIGAAWIFGKELIFRAFRKP